MWVSNFGVCRTSHIRAGAESSNVKAFSNPRRLTHPRTCQPIFEKLRTFRTQTELAPRAFSVPCKMAKEAENVVRVNVHLFYFYLFAVEFPVSRFDDELEFVRGFAVEVGEGGYYYRGVAVLEPCTLVHTEIFRDMHQS